MVQRPFNFAIVDEVDSILIDEARTPLIISGPSTDSSELYIAVDKVILHLEADDYEKDEGPRRQHDGAGTNKVEQILRDMGLLTEGTLYDIQNIVWFTTSTGIARPYPVPARQGLHRQGHRYHHR